MIAEEYISAWTMGKNNGGGFAVGDEDMTPFQAAVEEGYADIKEDDKGHVLCSDGDDLIVIKNFMLAGPWAVRIDGGDLCNHEQEHCRKQLENRRIWEPVDMQARQKDDARKMICR